MYTPVATYRIQLHQGFNFSHLLDLLPYLYDLGISTIYASPITRATAGSEHGYDVVDPLEINPEIGTMEQLQQVVAFMREKGMGWLQDIVPNHMAFSPDNEMLYDLMERGEESDFYSFFDLIPQYSPTGQKQMPVTRIMVPFLDKDLSDCLRDGAIKLGFGPDGFFVRYADQQYPVSVRSYHWICSLMPDVFQPLLAWCHKTASFSTLPWPDWVHFRTRMLSEVFDNLRLRNLALLYCDWINAKAALLEELLSFQPYALCSWQISFEQMNYRRFFAVNSLICLRMEEESVFDYWHQLMLALAGQGLIQGFRVDHVDGLFSPGAYLQKLRESAGSEAYLVVEKILQEKEEIISGWPVQGTTGYDFLGFVNQLMVDHAGKEKLTRYFQDEICPDRYEDMVFDKKLAFLKSHLQGEWNNLMRWLAPIRLQSGVDLDVSVLKEAVGVLMAAFPVYRVYADQLPLTSNDRCRIGEALAKASARAPQCREALHWLESLFDTAPEDRLAVKILYFIQRWSQYTAPLAAKGTEDTVFYNYHALMGLNEVGDSPGNSPVTAAAFHILMKRRQQCAPLSMNAGSTHDNKRGEDNRLRINLISRHAEEWIGLVEEWKKCNQPFIKTSGGRRAPSLNDEYMIYQALVGAIPDEGNQNQNHSFRKRFGDYLAKALREESQETNWRNPDIQYEKDCQDFLTAILATEHAFVQHFMPFVRIILADAAVFSLSQTLIRLTAPGIPDIYQGSELWNFSLVDPDNRLPVDYNQRKTMLTSILSKEKEDVESALAYVKQERSAGAQKLFLLKTILHFRRNEPELFTSGAYIPVISAPDLIGYIRRLGDQQLLLLIPLPSAIAGSVISGIPGIHGRWINLLTKQTVQLQDSIDAAVLLKSFPVGAFLLQKD